MKPSNLVEAQRIIVRIEAGAASQSDVVALLIFLREHLQDSDPIKDIAHCIAHTKRNKGIAYKYIEDFVSKVIHWAQNGGSLAVNVLFPLTDVIEQLIVDLQGQGLMVQPDALRQQTALLRKHFGDILDGVTLKLSNPYVVECRFATGDGNLQPAFLVKFKGLETAKALQVGRDVFMAFPVLVG